MISVPPPAIELTAPAANAAAVTPAARQRGSESDATVSASPPRPVKPAVRALYPSVASCPGIVAE